MSYLQYERMIDRALLSVVREALTTVEKEGLRADHHIYLTFLTNYPGVEIPDDIRAAYPEEITIVLQYEFWNLKVEADYFTVDVVFDTHPASIRVPFLSMVHIGDPSVNFELEFNPHIPSVSKVDFGQIFRKQTAGSETNEENGAEKKATVLSLDQFRKK